MPPALTQLVQQQKPVFKKPVNTMGGLDPNIQCNTGHEEAIPKMPVMVVNKVVRVDQTDHRPHSPIFSSFSMRKVELDQMAAIEEEVLAQEAEAEGRRPSHVQSQVHPGAHAMVAGQSGQWRQHQPGNREVTVPPQPGQVISGPQVQTGHGQIHQVPNVRQRQVTKVPPVSVNNQAIDPNIHYEYVFRKEGRHKDVRVMIDNSMLRVPTLWKDLVNNFKGEILVSTLIKCCFCNSKLRVDNYLEHLNKIHKFNFNKKNLPEVDYGGVLKTHLNHSVMLTQALENFLEKKWPHEWHFWQIKLQNLKDKIFSDLNQMMSSEEWIRASASSKHQNM